MGTYTIYVGGGRRDRQTTAQDMHNVHIILNTVIGDAGCYRSIYDKPGRKIAQAEHVLDDLIAISYIPDIAAVADVKDILRDAGITRCAVVLEDDLGNDLSEEEIIFTLRADDDSEKIIFQAREQLFDTFNDDITFDTARDTIWDTCQYVSLAAKQLADVGMYNAIICGKIDAYYAIRDAYLDYCAVLDIG